jgi:hypothetical protein
MEWTRAAGDRWIRAASPEIPFKLEVAPKGDGRWTWKVFARDAVNPMATGIARNLGAAKSVSEQLATRSS